MKLLNKVMGIIFLLYVSVYVAQNIAYIPLLTSVNEDFFMYGFLFFAIIFGAILMSGNKRR